MKQPNEELQILLTRYLSGNISDSEKELVNSWIKESSENEDVFNEYLRSWESISLLKEMEQFNSFEALRRVNSKIELRKPLRLIGYLQRAAAILILPIIIYSVYVTFEKRTTETVSAKEVIQKITTKPGMFAQFMLADGTKVWLNSGSELTFPVAFKGKKREVNLKGEAFFEVKENKKQPFKVVTSNLNIEVLGTSFNVMDHIEDSHSEVVLVHGKVALSTYKGDHYQDLGMLYPNQKAEINKKTHRVFTDSVDIKKYIAWREGYLVFRDDSMDEVANRMGRWFNVEIILNSQELRNYRFQATFKNESLIQVLNLLKLSSPIDYKISDRKLLANGEYTKQKITIMKKTN